jgi:3-hydroxyisobutyrate dehydrogenase-like beta-hydroxyacid dehydrogenase
MINKNYKPAQGTFEGLCHYFNLIEDLASTAEISTPLFRLSTDLFRRGIDYGLAEHDVAAIIEVIREISSEEKGKSKTRRSA